METTLLLVSGAIECLIVMFVAGRKSRKRIEDEATGGNFWGPNSYWEYAAFSALALAAYLFHRYR
jgi:hypothetical protein